MKVNLRARNTVQLGTELGVCGGRKVRVNEAGFILGVDQAEDVHQLININGCHIVAVEMGDFTFVVAS